MKQVLRRVLDGKGVIKVEELPVPYCGANQVLIATQYTAISAGTEGATLSKTFPELVKQSLQDPWMRNSVKNLIFGASPKAIKNIVWDETTLMRAIGYSGSGHVAKVGGNVSDFKPGDRVAFAAEGHAQFVAPSKHYVVPVPDAVSLEDASLVTLGGIAMQGVRRAEIQLGDKVAVIGMGLVGLLTAQLVAAAGGEVIGIDVNKDRLDELKALLPDAVCIDGGQLDPVNTVRNLAGGHGADVVIICAASKEPVIANQAMKMARKQGKVVFVGLVKMELERMPFFRSELDLRFSRAYGPGCMDPGYEKGHIDYPYHYVRWTEQRNLELFLELLASGKVRVSQMIGGTFPVDQAQEAYDKLYGGTLGGIAALIQYPHDEKAESDATQHIVRRHNRQQVTGKIRIGIIGCGNFTRGTHLPNLSSNKDFNIEAIATATGVNAVSIAKQYDIRYTTTDYHEILNDAEIDAILIATRHDLHAGIACAALAAGKHVFVEKPAALTWQQYNDLASAIRASDYAYMVGYNRRYAPLAAELKRRLSADLPMIVRYQVCVPEIPADHWTLDAIEGGGRLIGEAEHFFDFINYLAGSAPTDVRARCIVRANETVESQFNFSVDMQYGNQVIGSVVYTAYAAPGTSREVVTVYQGGQTLVLDNFKSLTIKAAKSKKIRHAFSDMGHKAELQYFASLVKGEKTTSYDYSELAASHISLSAISDLKDGASSTSGKTESTEGE